MAASGTCVVADTKSSMPPPPSKSSSREQSSTQRLFERCLYIFLDNTDVPQFYDSLALFDSLTRCAIPYQDDDSYRYSNLLIHFQYGERGINEIQSDMQYILNHGPGVLRDHFLGFLTMPLHTKAQRKAARQYLCALTGLPAELCK